MNYIENDNVLCHKVADEMSLLLNDYSLKARIPAERLK